MPSDAAHPEPSARREVDPDFLPHAYAGRPGADPLRALDFWTVRHPRDGAVRQDDLLDRVRARVRAERIAELARLVPLLKQLSTDPRPDVRMSCATCFSILARAGQAPADREVWRVLLGLSTYDDDAGVRSAASAALADLEAFGTVARAG